MSTKKSLRTLARILFLLGGLVLIVEVILQFRVGITGLLNITPRIPELGSIIELILSLVTGVLALAGIGQISNPTWCVILLILGFLSGGLGGILVILGGIIGLVSVFV